MQRYRSLALCALWLFCGQVWAGPEAKPLHDLFYGEALYLAYQNRHFDAITRLDIELGQFYAQDQADLDPLVFHQNEAEFNVGDLEISYRMHQRAGRALKAIIEGKVPQSVRNLAAFRLARILFRKGQAVNALHVMDLIKDPVAEAIRIENTFLKAQIYLATGRFKDSSRLLQTIQHEEKVRGYADYNLAIALAQDGQREQAVKQLTKVGGLRSGKPYMLALRDKANLALGHQYERKGMAGKAKAFLDRVRLDGPFSNTALLKAGWMYMALQQYDRALVPWTLLHKRQTSNANVQEALLAVPYAYGKLKLYGKAAALYGHAMNVFGNEVQRLDDSIDSIRQGKFLKAILREEAKVDKFWMLNLSKLPDAPQTRYLLDLMASHDFQESLKNYHDLAELQRRLKTYLPDLAVYEEMIEIRKHYYTPVLAKIAIQFRNLDTRIKLRVGQRDRLKKRIASMLINRRPAFLATAFEHNALESLAQLARRRNLDARTAHRIARLKGIVHWRLESEYDERLTRAYINFHELEVVIAALKKQYNAFVRTRQMATQSYEGYTIPIRQLRTRIQQSQRIVDQLMARQGKLLQIMAIAELERRRKKLEKYQIKARFALAESYDRANKAKALRLQKP